MSSSERFLVTQSLLSSWQWALKTEHGYADFLATLARKPTPQSPAMLDGIQFEGMVTAALDGNPPPTGHKWERGILKVAARLPGASLQVKLSRPLEVDGVSFVAYGILDALRAGHIYDIKFSKTYHVGKYLESPQHPMYFWLCPEALDFTYLVSDGQWLYRERYTPEDTEPIAHRLRHFMGFLARHGLVETYTNHWKSAY